MTVEKKNIAEVNQNLRGAYQKGVDMLRRHEVDYSITLLRGVLTREPGFWEARKALREAEKLRSQKLGSLAKFFASLKISGKAQAAKRKLAKAPLEALELIETALEINLDSPAALTMLAEIGMTLQAPFITAEALELAVEFHPDSRADLKKLSDFYRKTGEGRKALKIDQELLAKDPNNLDLQARLRETAALATMEQGSWNDDKSSFVSKTKEKEQDLTQGDRIIRAEDDVRTAISQLEARRKQGDDSLEVLRELGKFYLLDERFEDAEQTYQTIAGKMGTLDPAVDKAIEQAHSALMTRELDHLRAAGASRAELDAQAAAIFEYRNSRYEERIRLYPNDLQIRYEYAELLWEAGKVEEALAQFQLAQRNPQKRLSSMVYLGRCFAAKGQFDMAIDQFKKALAEMHLMDKDKIATLYDLGTTYEAMNRAAEALDCFKQIYAVNINFKDVAQKIETAYAAMPKA